VRNEVLAFETATDPPGLTILDQVEQLQYQLFTPEQVSPTPVPAEEFHFPVGSGLRVETDEIGVHGVAVIVRDEHGEMLAEVEHLECESFGEGEYVIELCAQIKTYLEVSGPVEIQRDMIETRCLFDIPRDVDLGFRSRHTQPAATVTTTTDPGDLMDAITTFGSALKTTSPERSFPLNRGHPPQIEFGETPDIPDGLEPPETGLSIEIPPSYDCIYPMAPLAYYLGADVVPGQTPRLVSNDGFEYTFDYPRGYEADIERTLKQVFTLDCVARTAGKHKVEMHERNVLDNRLDLDWAAVYDQSPAHRLESYLSVPYRLLEDQVPEWRLTVHVETSPDTARQLPFVVDDLAIVRTADGPTPAVTKSGSTDRLTRASRPGDDVLTRSPPGAVGTRSTAASIDEMSFVEPEQTESLEQAWIGDDIPIGASKLTIEAFENRLDREVTEGDISITIVANDERMNEEQNLVNQAYGTRENLPFDVEIRQGLTAAELRSTLEEERNFLHYIGHIDDDGFECVDGRLDATTLDDTGIDAFLLNACNSYQQGLALIRAGAIGGIVTLAEIINDRAVRIGETIARLLNTGFPLRAALTIARDEHILGGQYIVVGDGGVTVSQARSQVPNQALITPGEGGFTVGIRTSVTDTMSLGSVYRPHIGDNDEFYLTSGTIDTFDVTEAQLSSFLELENVPVKLEDGTLDWSFNVCLPEHR